MSDAPAQVTDVDGLRHAFEDVEYLPGGIVSVGVYLKRVLPAGSHYGNFVEFFLSVALCIKAGRHPHAVVDLEHDDLAQSQKAELGVAEPGRHVGQYVRVPGRLVPRRLCGHAIRDPQRQLAVAVQREQRIVDGGSRTAARRVHDRCHAAGVQSGEIGREAVFAFFVAGCGYSGKKPRERTDVAEQLARRQAFFIPLDLDAGYRRILLVQPER